jgi:hypothetical protein
MRTCHIITLYVLPLLSYNMTCCHKKFFGPSAYVTLCVASQVVINIYWLVNVRKMGEFIHS